MSRSRSVSAVVGSRDDLERLAVGLLQAAMPLPKAVRLLGVSLPSRQREAGEVSQLDLAILND
jgi:DNA polymerase-4